MPRTRRRLISIPTQYKSLLPQFHVINPAKPVESHPLLLLIHNNSDNPAIS